MNNKYYFAVWLVAVFCLLFLVWPMHDKATIDLKTPIYDETADASKQIAEALVAAKKQNKKVLVQFGANWCGWCHVLYYLFQSDEIVREKLQADYIFVLVDVDNSHNTSTIEQYSNPTQSGLPFIVIINP